MKNFLIIVSFLNSINSIGQNLVPNPSFEDTLSCPFFIPTLNATTYWSSFAGSADNFNPCANTSNPLWGVPNNVVGFQNAYHGNAYAGLVGWCTGQTREFAGVHLTSPLVIGTKYFASCYVSNADSADGMSGNYNSSINNFGIRLTTFAYSLYLIDNFSQIHADSIISDKINWTRISGSFIADSAYEYLSFGNFYDDAHTLIDTMPFAYSCAYYYVDAVCLSTDSLYDLNWISVDEINIQNTINIFPNPFTDKITFTTKTNELVELTLFDITSRRIFNQFFSKSISINTEQLSEGIYLYQVRSKNGVIQNGKVVKQ